MKNKNKVWVNGTFDVLHIGHLNLLRYASELGELTVAIDSDKRVKELKGKNRPFNSLENRILFLESLKYVKNVLSFDTREELENLIKNFNPDYIVVGDDYENKEVIGSSHCKNLVFYKKIPNISTSKILNYE
jgi:rfaE bifunctional protein nucleotidyltransferase chain/domain